MSEIRFYHLMTRGVEQALPEILQKALAGGRRAVVRTADDAQTESLNAHLWAWRAESFLPHGSKKDGHGPQQPVWLTPGEDNPNAADIVVVTGGAVLADGGGFALLCDLFDGRDETAVRAARERWKIYKAAGHTMAYWQQTENGWVQNI